MLAEEVRKETGIYKKGGQGWDSCAKIVQAQVEELILVTTQETQFFGKAKGVGWGGES